ncbi:MAG TPA: hypothetical protein VFH51_12020, partial [Myxococcota bacterium]|nr:hypothetical protein [Myxococcota bacterium]
MSRTTYAWIAALALLWVPSAATAALEQDVILKPHPNRREFGMIPLVGGDSDFGIAVGAIASVASFEETATPYLWRAEISAMQSFKHDRSGWQNPFQDYYVKMAFPALFDNQFSLTLRAAYTRYNQLWYY